MKRLIPYGTLLALGALVWALSHVAPAQMPQAIAGGDVLSVLLGDAKKDISGAMVREADSYFHGGVDMDCHHLRGNHSHAHHGHAHHGHEHHAEEDHDHAAESFDPWRWINSRIRAPEIDRHLDGGKAVEMMPWFWVAIKSDPHNVEAWSTAWYAASHLMQDEALALRIAIEGQRLNPQSLEMACVLGRAYRAETTRDDEKSEAMFHKVLELADGRKELEENDALPLCSALGYLADTAKRRNDTQELATLLNVARRFAPDHPTTRSIERMLEPSR